jgi:hypothetical protein
MIIPHEQSEIQHHLMRGWFPDLPRGRGRSIGGDLNVSEEGSEQTIVTLQSTHHVSVGYQHVHT